MESRKDLMMLNKDMTLNSPILCLTKKSTLDFSISPRREEGKEEVRECKLA